MIFKLKLLQGASIYDVRTEGGGFFCGKTVYSADRGVGGKEKSQNVVDVIHGNPQLEFGNWLTIFHGHNAWGAICYGDDEKGESNKKRTNHVWARCETREFIWVHSVTKTLHTTYHKSVDPLSLSGLPDICCQENKLSVKGVYKCSSYRTL